jgi:hypothetical protein
MMMAVVMREAREILNQAMAERGLRPMDGLPVDLRTEYRYGEPALVFWMETVAVTAEADGEGLYRMTRWCASVIYEEVRNPMGQLTGYLRVGSDVRDEVTKI